MARKYDIVLVGAGLTSATIAALMPDKRILVVEKDKIGGMCRTENVEGIDVHVHGPHIFHTSNKKVWEFVNRYAEFNGYVHRAKATVKGQVESFPVNLDTIEKYLGVDSPERAKQMIFEGHGDNFEDFLISKIGSRLYEAFYKHYTEKFWGIPAREVPRFIAERVPIRTTRNDLYFNDRYQGIPISGYSNMIANMLDGVNVEYADFNQDKAYFEALSDVIIHTGSIDEYFDYCHGPLGYRSCEYITSSLDIEDFQGIGQMNHPDPTVLYTRTIEHKHFNWVDLPYTIISTEYPLKWTPEGNVSRFYPIPTNDNKQLYDKYASMDTKVKFLGRLGAYRYLNMDQCVLEAMEMSERLFNK